MKRFLTRLLVAGVACLAYTGAVHADPTWTYTTTASPLAIAPDVPGGGLVLTSQSTPSQPVTGASGIVATTVLGSISVGTDHYTNAGYEVDIMINDKNGGSHTFAFHGAFSGDFSATTGSHITHVLMDPATGAPSSSAVSQTADINGNTYTVTLDPNVIIGPLGSFPASIGGHVTTSGSNNGDTGNTGNTGGDNGNTQTAPEPSTMLLSMLGLSVLGVSAIRRRLRRQAA
jgi:hypothetical protein